MPEPSEESAALPCPPAELMPIRDSLLRRAARVLALLAAAGCGPEADAPPAVYVGSGVCVACHEAEGAAWRGSHHERAMRPATAHEAAGDFSGSSFGYFGRTTTFVREGEDLLVRAPGRDSAVVRRRVAWVVGTDPLEQYVVEDDAGRLQVLGVAWDTRPRGDGGGRWYHLYPEEDVRPGDPLHWTGAEQRFNHQCVACHATGVHKGYDPVADRYATTWAEPSVGCEACHGAGSGHVAWARAAGAAVGARLPGGAGEVGLQVDLAEGDGGAWLPGSGPTAARVPMRTDRPELAVCGPCHARRELLDETPTADAPLFDRIRPALLDQGLYWADGQILDEVFVLGSFLQSRMARAGVTCGDCHEPHGLGLRAPGNALCARCHAPAVFDVADHHRHEAGSTGSACVACHMPARTYMGHDARRDHGFRIPRAELAVELGTPEPCTPCHADRDAAWAARIVAGWSGQGGGPHFAEALSAAWRGEPGAEAALREVAADTAVAAIVRTTALDLLGRRPGAAVETLLQAVLTDPDPLVRYGAARAAGALGGGERRAALAPLLDDPSLLVRTETARQVALAGGGVGAGPRFEAALEAYLETQAVSEDRPEARVNAAAVLAAVGRWPEAEEALRAAVRAEPPFEPAYVNYAELLRATGRDPEGERVLREGIERVGPEPALRHALGLFHVRVGRLADALPELRGAAEAAPRNARFAYVYGVALHAAGEKGLAVEVLEEALARHPADVELLTALLAYHRDAGRIDEALALARRWEALAPGDPAAAAERDRLEAAAGR